MPVTRTSRFMCMRCEEVLPVAPSFTTRRTAEARRRSVGAIRL